MVTPTVEAAVFVTVNAGRIFSVVTITGGFLFTFVVGSAVKLVRTLACLWVLVSLLVPALRL